MIVLDTNVISELIKPITAPVVEKWAAQQMLNTFFATSISQAEVWTGLEIMPAGKRRDELRHAAENLFSYFFRERTLAFDTAAARAYAEIVADRRRAGRPIGTFDAQIAAIAQVVGATVATRNVRDFESCGITVIDPWAGAASR